MVFSPRLSSRLSPFRRRPSDPSSASSSGTPPVSGMAPSGGGSGGRSHGRGGSGGGYMAAAAGVPLPVFPPPPVLPLAAPATLSRYASSALDTDRLRTPVLVYASYGRGERLVDTVALAGNGGRRFLRELHTMTGAIQGGTFLLEADHLQRLYALYETLRAYASFYEATVTRVWGRWLPPPDNTGGGGDGGVRAGLEGVRAALAATDATWSALAAAAPDAAPAVAPVLRGCHALSAAAAVVYGRVEATIGAALAAEAAAAATAASAADRRRTVRAVEAGVVAAAEAAFPGGRGLLVLAHWLPTEAYVAKFMSRHLPSGVSGVATATHRKRLSKEEATARAAAADAAARRFAAGRAAYEEASHQALAFFERHQGAPTALPGGAGRPRLALLPAPVGTA
ncbi:hypothetical protein MMPV_001427 [Pyropia vietnamensis]